MPRRTIKSTHLLRIKLCYHLPEWEAISERIKAALAAVKARGKRLGTIPAGAVKRIGKALKAKTIQFAANVLWPAPPMSKNALIGTTGSTPT